MNNSPDFLTRETAALMLTKASIDARAERMDSEATALIDAADLVRLQPEDLPIYAMSGTHLNGIKLTMILALRCHIFAGSKFRWVGPFRQVKS